MPPVQGSRFDDVIMPPNNSDPLMERKHSDKDRLIPNGISNGHAHYVEINPWPSGTPVRTKYGFVPTLKRVCLVLVTVLFLSTLIILASDQTTVTVQFDANISPKPIPIGCYLKTADRKGNFALMEEPELLKRGCERRLPQAIIAGTKKGGTTTLKYFLSFHPDIAMATEEMKFFNMNYKKGLEWYKENMPYSTGSQVTMEKTPGYYVSHNIPERINSLLNSSTKVIIMMRDPVKRAISDFVHMTTKINCKDPNKDSKHCARLLEVEDYKKRSVDNVNKTDDLKPPSLQVAKSLESHHGKHYEIHQTFQESVLFPNGTVKRHNLLVDKGIYIDHLQYWFKSFPPDRLLLLDGERFVTDPGPSLRAVESFLGVRHYFSKDQFYFDEDKHFFCLKKPFRNCMSDSKGRDHPEVNDEVVHRLREFYRPYNEKLAPYLNTSTLWNYP